MRDKELTMTLTLTVSGSEGWQKVMHYSLESIGQLVESNLTCAKGDGSDHTFEYKIALSDGKQYDCPACGSHLIFESDVADLKNTFGLTEPDFDLMLNREKR